MATPLYTVCNGQPVPNVGLFIHLITIQSQGLASPPTYDAAGPVVGWIDLTTVMAGIETVRGTDVIKGGQTTTQLYLTLTMWYAPGVLPNMRVISDNGNRYIIQSIENILERNVVMVLNCLGLGPND